MENNYTDVRRIVADMIGADSETAEFEIKYGNSTIKCEINITDLDLEELKDNEDT